MLPISTDLIATRHYESITDYIATVSDVNSFFSFYEISTHYDELTPYERDRWFRLRHNVSVLIRSLPFDSRVPRLVCFSIILFFTPNAVEHNEVTDYES